jgi:hypothetical protein
MQSQHCTTDDASAAAKTQTLIAGTLRCSRGVRKLSGGTQDCARRFHVMQKTPTVTEKVLRGEHRPRMTDNNNSLSNTKYVRLTNFKNLTKERRTSSIRHMPVNYRPKKHGHPKKCSAIFGASTPLPQRSLFQRLVPVGASHQTRADDGRGKIHQGASQKCCD